MPKQAPADTVAQLRGLAKTVGLTEEQEATMRREAGGPPDDPATIEELCARLTARASQPLKTPGLMMEFVNGAKS